MSCYRCGYAAGRGHGEVVELLLGVVDNPTAMILQPNKERLSPWHLTLMRSELMDGDNGQQAALHMLKIAGEASAAEAAGEGMPGTTGTEQDAGATRTEGQEEEEEEEEASAPLLPADAHSVDRAGGTAPAEVSVMQLLLQPIQNDIGGGSAAAYDDTVDVDCMRQKSGFSETGHISRGQAADLLVTLLRTPCNLQTRRSCSLSAAIRTRSCGSC